MSEQAWTITIALVTFVTGGALIKYLEWFKANRKDGQTFVNDQYQKLLEDEQRARESVVRRNRRLEDDLDLSKGRLQDQVTENIHLKGLLNEAYRQCQHCNLRPKQQIEESSDHGKELPGAPGVSN